MGEKVEKWIEKAARSAVRSIFGWDNTDDTYFELIRIFSEHCPYGWRPMDQRPRAQGIYAVRPAGGVWKGSTNRWLGRHWSVSVEPKTEWLDDGRPADPDPDEEAFQKARKSHWKEGPNMITESASRFWFMKGRESTKGERP